MWRPWLDYFESLGSTARATKDRADKDCGCEDACSCCVPDAEIVVHARAGERRIVAFELHNRTRREKEVHLGVGEWMHCSGPRLHVLSDFDAPDTITLAPCDSRVIRMSIVMEHAAEQRGDEKRVTRDIEACASAYADVRFDGCSRPVRVALVVHPSACDAYEVTCDCGCC
jgi:hypothetical protein